jgi:hypothetical protein
VDGSLRAVLRPEVDEADTVAAESAHRWRMVISYDGTKYKGFSRPPCSALGFFRLVEFVHLSVIRSLGLGRSAKDVGCVE